MSLVFSSAPLILRGVPIGRTPAAVVDFVLRNPAIVPILSVEDRIEILAVLAASREAAHSAQCAQIQGVAGVVIASVIAVVEAVVAIVDALGGPRWLRLNMIRFTNPDLRALAQKMLHLHMTATAKKAASPSYKLVSANTRIPRVPPMAPRP